ncbi:hypothetical protein LXA43DRAFT_1089827 [Ganoderma leucocontextum]|nr:hypothetical protein LXA43DRAFT_1089827 [Ganoderma leucocontextum]
MSDEPPNAKTCTRPELKSCLKLTPPITPELSAAPSPSTSGRTSPAMVSDSGSSADSGGRKTVSFCEEDELEEIFWADEWDRTPAAVTPKLSYQDILELKQLRINLPCSPPPPPPRPPFTTSLSSASKPPFPLSRFANAVSHTPSKWKNRSAPQRADVDPAILPYLDAVPIRLLPLLPQPPTESELSPSDPPEPHPQTPTPTASPEARPTIKPPSELPELRIVEPAIPLPVQPITARPSSRSPPKVKKPTFSFLPLLPVEDPPIPSAPVVQSAPTPPRRKFNMTFLPVNSLPDPDPSSVSPHSYVDRSLGSQSESALLPSQTTFVSGPDPLSLPDAGHLYSEVADCEVCSLTPTTSTSNRPCMSPPPLSLSLPATSFLPVAVESDTDTDTYTDTDGESDAHSTSTVASSVSSPPCEYEDGPELDDLKIDPGSYFPPVPPVLPLMDPLLYSSSHEEATEAASSPSAEPGQTPPLSVLFPSPRRQNRALPPLASAVRPQHMAETPATLTSLETDSSMPPSDRPSISLPPSLVSSGRTAESSLPTTPLFVSRVLQKKLMLEALPSPALVPPSPFELEPHRGGAGPKLAQAVQPESISAHHGHQVLVEKLECLRVSELLSDSERGRPVASLVSRVAAANTPGESPSPMLTLESMRVAWDATAREGIAAAKPGAVPVLAASLSRRRLS